MLKYSVCVTPGCDARTPVSPICLACYHKALGLEMLQTQTAGCGLFAAISNVQEGDILLPYLGEVSRVVTASKSPYDDAQVGQLRRAAAPDPARHCDSLHGSRYEGPPNSSPSSATPAAPKPPLHRFPRSFQNWGFRWSQTTMIPARHAPHSVCVVKRPHYDFFVLPIGPFSRR